ncbi:MAG TPA: diaminobutyrate--2-oxoglutarate transaminase [Salinisphaeraceae bacterium]|nr:diaminobutyrate--2-oxoglutarate transaminase [Salinisphaeraceae bacterium]
METINRLESEVRGYVRSFPVEFASASGSRITAADGTVYLDFFGGAGALNYGHNEATMKAALIDYLQADGIAHGLDLATTEKIRFLETFEEVIMQPRGLDYKIQFPGPTGTNAVEAALKLARKVKERHSVLYFTNGYHGMTLGSLSVTGNASKRAGAGVSLSDTMPLPYSDYYGDGRDTAADFQALLENTSSGVEKPAAVILETVQGEGGVNVADYAWLQRIEKLCREHDILLIVDDIQAGVGRTGPFFSFEPAGIKPDIVTLSKSLSGMGLPFAVTLLRPDLDAWDPGEHNGTFRGNNHAFVTATVALERYWRDDKFEQETLRKGEMMRQRIEKIVADSGLKAEVRGRGMFLGIDCENPALADKIAAACFERKLLMETAGANDNVVKFMLPLTTTDAEIEEGLDIVAAAIQDVLRAEGLVRGVA